MALNRRELQTVQVNGLGYHDYRQLKSVLLPGQMVDLVADPSNLHDSRAVKVCLTGRQIGWVPRAVNKDIASRLAAGEKLTAKVLNHPRDGDLTIEVFAASETAEAPLGWVALSSVHVTSPGSKSMQSYPPGTIFRLQTSLDRLSVTLLTFPGMLKVGWFRKTELTESVKALLDGPRNFAGVVSKAGCLDIYPIESLVVQSAGTQPGKAGIAEALAEARAATSGQGYHFGRPSEQENTDSFYTEPPEAYEIHSSQTPKENTMSLNNKISNTVTATVDFNKNAASAAAYQEAGRIAVNQLTKVASKSLPMMVRGYADTAIGKLVIANLAQMAAAQLRPEDKTLAKLTFAMTTAAYAEVIRTIDIEAMLDGLMGTPEIQRAINKMPKDTKPMDEAGYLNEAKANRDHLAGE